MSTDNLTRNVFVTSILALALGSANAAIDKEYLAIQAGDQLVRLPRISGFLPACEESPGFAERTKKAAPASHVFLTCGVDAAIWREFMQGKTQPNFYPMFVVTVQRHQQGGPLTRDEFSKIEAMVRAQTGKMLSVDKETSQRNPRMAVTEKGNVRAVDGYEQKMQEFFETQSKLPSFSLLMNRSYAVSEGGKTTEFHESTAITSVYYRGELLQVMVINATESNGATSRLKKITQDWLDGFNALNQNPTP